MKASNIAQALNESFKPGQPTRGEQLLSVLKNFPPIGKETNIEKIIEDAMRPTRDETPQMRK